MSTATIAGVSSSPPKPLVYNAELLLSAETFEVMGLYKEWQPDGNYRLWTKGVTGYLWGLRHGSTLVGMLHGLTVQSPYPPHARGVVDSHYVSPSHRHQAWRLWRHAYKAAKALWVERVIIYADHGTLPFWEHHRFEITAYMMERNL